MIVIVISILLTVPYGVVSDNMTDPMLETSEVDGSRLEKRTCTPHGHPCIATQYKCCSNSPICHQLPHKPYGVGICGSYCTPMGAVPLKAHCCSGHSMELPKSRFHRVCTERICKCIPNNWVCSWHWSNKKCCNGECVHEPGLKFGFCRIRKQECLPPDSRCKDSWKKKCCGTCYYRYGEEFGECDDDYSDCVPIEKQVPTLPECCGRGKAWPTNKKDTSVCGHQGCAPRGAWCNPSQKNSPTICCSGDCVNHTCSRRKCIPHGHLCSTKYSWAMKKCCKGECQLDKKGIERCCRKIGPFLFC